MDGSLKGTLIFLAIILIIAFIGYYNYENNYKQVNDSRVMESGECCQCNYCPKCDACCSCRVDNIFKKVYRGWWFFIVEPANVDNHVQTKKTES